MLPAFQFGVAPPLEASSLDWGTIRIVPEVPVRPNCKSTRKIQPVPRKLKATIITPLCARPTRPSSRRPTTEARSIMKSFSSIADWGTSTCRCGSRPTARDVSSVTNDGAETVHSLFLVEVGARRDPFRPVPAGRIGAKPRVSRRDGKFDSHSARRSPGQSTCRHRFVRTRSVCHGQDLAVELVWRRGDAVVIPGSRTADRGDPAHCTSARNLTSWCGYWWGEWMC